MASLAVWGIFCLTFFREGCSPAARLDEPPLLATDLHFMIVPLKLEAELSGERELLLPCGWK